MLTETTTSNLSSPTMMVLCIVMLLVWVSGYAIIQSRGHRVRRMLCLILRALLGTSAMLVALKYLATVATLLTTWPLWLLAAMAGAGMEAIFLLYLPQLNKISRKTAFAMLLLRGCVLIGVVIMLAQPAWTWKTQKKDRKTVVVLIDNSASMHILQSQSTKEDLVRIAEATGKLKRPAHFEQTQFDIQRTIDEMGDWLEWLGDLKAASDSQRNEQFPKYRKGFEAALQNAKKTVDSASRSLASTEKLTEVIGADQQARINRIIDQAKLILDTQSTPALEKLTDQLSQTADGNIYQAVVSLSGEMRPLMDSLKQANQKAKTLAQAADIAFFETLSDKQKQQIAQSSEKTRYDIVWDVLARSRKRIGGETYAPSLLSELVDNFDTRLVTFATRATELDVTQWSQQSAMVLKDLPKSPQDHPLEKQKTDLTDALRHAAAVSRDTSVAGVLVLSDMRHNASDPLKPVVEYLAKANVSIYPVCAGSSTPPVDAAVMSVETPDSVFPEDDMVATVKIKLTGLEGKNVRLNLIHKNQIVDTQTVVAQSPDSRQTVKMIHGPGKIGTYAYKVQIEPIKDEVLSTNNEYSFSLSVKDDKTRVLFIANRPRWEFRYLKNLLETRDESVRFQYVLLHPDSILGQPTLKPVSPSVDLARVQTRATALPQRHDDWMKFDIIILGDVSPKQLGYPAIDALCEFVTQNGGTLVCIPGPRAMPNAYAATNLAKILPVETGLALTGLQSPDRVFKVALSDEGQSHIITQLSDDAQGNRQIWNAFEPSYWRCPIKSVKPSAAVLAYALTPSVPKPATSQMTTVQRRQRMKEIDNYIRNHALITIQNVSLGKVMLMGYDSTWKMRYRVGDTYHHRFWGQVLRWAISDRMMNGTSLVKIQTDNARYKPNRNVKVKARILDTDFSPLVVNEVPVNLIMDDKIIAMRKLKNDSNSPGMYYGDLGRIKVGGAYKVELVGSDVNRILEHEGKPGQAFTVFSVDRSTLDEQIELTIDNKTARYLASTTNGAVLTSTNARNVLSLLGENTQSHPINITWTLWDSWLLLAVLIGLVTAEWIIRKSAGLS